MGDRKWRDLALARRAIAVAFPCLLMWIVPLGSIAWAAETRSFDATLSLTGNCSTSSLDLIPDPGCPEGAHPSSAFAAPKEVITDSHGDIFVANWGEVAAEGEKGVIDIFDPHGLFLEEIPDSRGPESIAVDSLGNLYVVNHRPGNFENQLVRYAPTVFNPTAGEIDYGNSPVVIKEGGGLTLVSGLAVNPLNDHLFVHYGNRILEFKSASEGNELQSEEIGASTLHGGSSVAIDAAHGRIYASDSELSLAHSKIRVFELAPPHALVRTNEGSTTPKGSFLSESGLLGIAVDEKTGHVFVYDSNAPEAVVYEFTESDEYVSTILHKFKEVLGAKIGIANGASNLDRGYLFVPSNESGVGHSYAFEPLLEVCAPEVMSVFVGGITETEAQAGAKINPCGAETTYIVEYTTQENFESKGFADADIAGQGVMPAGNELVEVTAPITGLTSGTAYRIRVVAKNSEGEAEAERPFSTYPSAPVGPCPNDVLRTGASTKLADCRANELVTPAETNGREPMGVGRLGFYFNAMQAAPTGGKVSFRTEGGAIPGYEGTGNLGGDPYLAVRGEEGWHTVSAGPSGTEARALNLGSTSLDQGYSFWTGAGGGTAVLEGETNYVRYPDGHSELVGQGAIGTDREAAGRLISPNGSHVVFRSDVPIEEGSPAAGTVAIYDRTADGGTHLVSVLPNETTPSASATYWGASIDGDGIVFSIGSTLYLRLNDAATYELGEGVTLAGVSKSAKRVFYLDEGDLWSFEPESEEREQFTSFGDVTVVNIASTGARAYFVSPTALPGLENPNGAVPQEGEENLYLSEEGVIQFIGAVTQRDVEGAGKNEKVDGLGRWVPSVSLGDGLGGFGADPSRTTPDGTVFLFESRADLTGYEGEGKAEIYRYDSESNELTCLSCNPTGVPAQGEASLESVTQGLGDPEPFSAVALVANMRPDGQRAFFQSTEALVPGDTDGLLDVYEWEEQGVGSCEQPGGCVFLISSGHSLRNDYLYAVSETGDDVFFRSGDRLVGSDTDATPSIYDARVGGGFAEDPEVVCQGEGCRPGMTTPPSIPGLDTGTLGPPDKIPPQKTCPKGKHRVKRHGKQVCVKKKHHHGKHKDGKKGAAK